MKKLDIIYEDKEFLVVNKPCKLLSIGTLKNKDNTLYHEVREYIRKKNQKVFIVNRLDKDTSGIVLFVKNEKLKLLLQEKWNDISIRKYYAIVEGVLENKIGTLGNYLFESKTLEVFVSKNNKGKVAILDYEVIKENKNYSLLDIRIKTGRRNQIRCQLDYINHPIVGDKKYNSSSNPMGRLGLHAYYLKIIHPVNGREYEFEAKPDKSFFKII